MDIFTDWRYLVVAFFVVFLLSTLMTIAIMKKSLFLKKKLSRFLLLKEYWIYVAVIVFGVIIIYGLFLTQIPAESQENYLPILNTSIALTFAIFIGNYAFMQLAESRFDKLREEGYRYFNETKPKCKRALERYEESHRIKPNNVTVLTELIEIYIAMDEYDKAEEKIDLLKELDLEDDERVTLLYLKATLLASKGFASQLRDVISELISLKGIKANWDFKPFGRSDAYKKISGEPKKLFDNLIKYHNSDKISSQPIPPTGQLTSDDLKKFEDGNYLLPDQQ